MQWDTVIAAVGGATVVAAGCAIFLKGVVDRLLDSKLKVLEERRKQSEAERTRREAKLFDEQLEPLRTMVAITYRARNTARQLSKGSSPDAEKLVRQLGAFHDSYAELLFEVRAFLPEAVHNHLHDMKHKLNHYRLTIEDANDARTGRLAPKRRTEIQEANQQRLTHAFTELDEGYSRMLEAVQSHLHSSEA